MNGTLDSATSDFSTIIKSGSRFFVPKFQRDYSWEDEQWDDLWRDVECLEKDGESHYMGYLVLQESANPNKEYKIIDGQQRFTTLSLLILAVVKRIKAIGRDNDDENEEKRAKSLMDDYIGSLDAVTLEYNNKLVLNRNNDSYYRDYIVKMGRLAAGSMTATQKLTKRCFEFFEKKLTEGDFASYSGRDYASFITYVVGHTYFTKITVGDEMNAFKVFETLNARGVQLSSADLLKNYLFSLVDENKPHESRFEVLENKWTTLTDKIKSEKLPEFIRHYWNTQHKIIRSKDVFKTFRDSVRSEEQVFALLNEMVDFADIYSALKNPSSDLWEDEETRGMVKILNLFGLKQPYSALMAAYKFLSKDEFKRVLKNILNICFRYNVICDKHTNDQEVVFNNLALSITEKHTASLPVLSQIAIDDETFKQAFATCSFSDREPQMKKVRYILGRIEKERGGLSDVTFDRSEASIEHILPRDYGEHWEVEKEVADRMVNRLGNMCLLERRPNRDLGNAPFKEKVEAYRNSVYKTTKAVAEHFEEWTEDEVNTRQRRMSEVAPNIWKIDLR